MMPHKASKIQQLFLARWWRMECVQKMKSHIPPLMEESEKLEGSWAEMLAHM